MTTLALALLGLRLLLGEDPARPVGPDPAASGPPAPASGDPPRASTIGTEIAGAEPAPAAAGAAPITTTTARWSGLLTRDGAPWEGGAIRLEELDLAGRPTGRVASATASEGGRFALEPLAAGWWSVVPAPGWPAGATAAVAVAGAGEPLERVDPERGALVALCVSPAGDDDGPPGASIVEVPGEPGWRLLVDARAPLSVDGRVVDVAGTPVAGATVSVRDDPDPEAEPVATGASDRDGAFVVAAPAWLGDGRVALVAHAPGHGPGGATIDLRDIPRRATIRLALEVPLEGLVRDLDGRPVAGATVRVSTLLPAADAASDPLEHAAQVRSGADGRFRLAVPGGSGDPPAGPRAAHVKLAAEHPDHPAGGALEVDVPARDPVVVVVTGRVAVAGRVLGPDGAPASKARLRFHWSDRWDDLRHDVEADVDGRFVVEGELPELLEVEVDHDDLATQRWLLALPVEGPLVLRLPAGDTIEGRVVDVQGRPARLAHVSAGLAQGPADARRVALARASPRRGQVVELPPLPFGESRVSREDGAFRLGPYGAGVDVRLGVGGRFTTVRPGARGVVLTSPLRGEDLVRGARLRLVAAESGLPLEGGWLLESGHGSSTTGDGRCEVGLPVVAGAVSVWSRGRVTTELRFEAGEQGLDLGDVRLERGATLELLARWPARPLKVIRARWRDPAGRPVEREGFPSARPDEAWATVDGLAPGDHTIEAEAETLDGEVHAAPPVTVHLRAGETARVVVDLEAALR